MVLGVDIGGTKTLLGVFDKHGNITYEKRFATPKNYSDFLVTFLKEFRAIKEPVNHIVVAAPGRLDRKSKIVIAYGNLPWKNTDIKTDIACATNCKVDIENDAKLAALAETLALPKPVEKSLYITFSTGIGAGLVHKGSLDTALIDSEAGQMLLPNPESNNRLEKWESFASGKALFEKYGMKAEEINDESIWREFVKKMSIGIVELCAVVEPDVIIIGGSVGEYYKKYGVFLEKAIFEILPPMVKKPVVKAAAKADLAPLNGCFEYSKVTK